MSAPPRGAVLLDRDGTVIVDTGYLQDPADVALLPGSAEALRALSTDFELVVISNQSGIGRGWIHQSDADRVHRTFVELLADHGVRLAGSFYCPHAPDAGCDCRKPLPGLIARAQAALNLDLSASWMIGDRLRDVEAGQAAGCRTIAFTDPSTALSWEATATTSDWSAIPQIIAADAISAP